MALGGINCNNNRLPDECETHWNAHGILDPCDVTQDPTADCNLNGTVDAREGTTLICAAYFETGLPARWSADGLWHLTDQGARAGACNPAHWA